MAVSLFSPLQLGPFTVPNRIFMAPMTRSRAGAGGIPTALNALYYAQRASAGLIITEATQISQQGTGYLGTPGIHNESQANGWRLVTNQVHAAGGKIFQQLVHSGRISHPSFQPHQTLPVAPSAIAAGGKVLTADGLQPLPVPRALEAKEIPAIIDQFHAAAKLSMSAGFDGVELHAANGYLVDQFLRDGTNQRGDAYGGSPEGRSRLLREAILVLIDVWGASRVGVRLSPSGAFNDMRDSNPHETFGYAVSMLGKLGLAYLHINEAQESDVRHGAIAIPAAFFRPLFSGVLVTNGGFTKERANQYLADGHADAVAFGVPFLANPDLPARFAKGVALNTPDVSTFYGGSEVGYTDYPAFV